MVESTLGKDNEPLVIANKIEMLELEYRNPGKLVVHSRSRSALAERFR